MTPSPHELSPVVTLAEPPPDTTRMATLGKYRKFALITVFSLAQFMDAFNNSSLFPAVPILSKIFNIKPNETTWLFAAYQATFAAFLLIVCLWPAVKLYCELLV